MRPVVALRKESVDRNFPAVWAALSVAGSLSARRAWIEIKLTQNNRQRCTVALRKESVDRNTRAASYRSENAAVALRKESVDRNFLHGSVRCAGRGRSPQGERG